MAAVFESLACLAESRLPYRTLAGTNKVTTRAKLLCSTAHSPILYRLILYMLLFFEAVYQQSPLDAVVTFLPMIISTIALTAATPAVIKWLRHYRVILTIDWLLSTVFMGLWCTVGSATLCVRIIAYQVMFGMGGAGFALPLSMLASVPHVHDAGLASGLLMTVRLTGGFIGLTIASNLRRSTDSLGTQLPESLRGKLLGARNAIDFILALKTLDLPKDVMARLVETYREAFRTIWMACRAEVTQ